MDTRSSKNWEMVSLSQRGPVVGGERSVGWSVLRFLHVLYGGIRISATYTFVISGLLGVWNGIMRMLCRTL